MSVISDRPPSVQECASAELQESSADIRTKRIPGKDQETPGAFQAHQEARNGGSERDSKGLTPQASE
jgi:hypothetical protein